MFSVYMRAGVHVRREQDGPDSDAAADAPSPEQPFPETEACHVTRY